MTKSRDVRAPQCGLNTISFPARVHAQDTQAALLHEPLVMGDDDQRAGCRRFREQAHDVPGAHGIERRRGLVGQHEPGFGEQGAGDGDPLAFADGHFVREGVQHVRDTEPFPEFRQAPPDRSGVHALRLARRGDVARARQEGQQAARLQHVTDMAQAQIGHAVAPPAPPQVGHVLRAFVRAQAEGFGLVRLQDHGEEVQRGAFAATGGAEQGDFLARRDGGTGRVDGQPVGVAARFALQGDLAQFVEIHEENLRRPRCRPDLPGESRCVRCP